MSFGRDVTHAYDERGTKERPKENGVYECEQAVIRLHSRAGNTSIKSQRRCTKTEKEKHVCHLKSKVGAIDPRFKAYEKFISVTYQRNRA